MKLALGKHFSEGTRRLWLVKIAQQLTQSEMARRWFGGQQSLVSKILWGRRRPTLEQVVGIEGSLGISASLWTKPPIEEFTPPAIEEARRDLGVDAGDSKGAA